MIMEFNARFKRICRQKGFTLVELIVVMAILALLTALAVPKFGQILEDAKYKTHNQNVIMIYKAGQMYVAANGTPTAVKTIADLKTEGFLTTDSIVLTYDGSKRYTCTIGTDGEVTVTPGLATKSGDSWTADADYKGE